MTPRIDHVVQEKHAVLGNHCKYDAMSCKEVTGSPRSTHVYYCLFTNNSNRDLLSGSALAPLDAHHRDAPPDVTPPQIGSEVCTRLVVHLVMI
jgi:hypothetical protein